MKYKNNLGLIMSKQIKTYSLNKEFDFIQPICSSCQNIECVATEGHFDISQNMTICVRLGNNR